MNHIAPSGPRRHVVVVGTGGTITGQKKAADGYSYAPAVTGIDEVLTGVEGLTDLADISSEQVFQVDSSEMTQEDRLTLARRVQSLLDRDDVDAVAIAHGTDTLEESAFFLNLVLDSDKPVVFLGSMRPADALSADGPDNLYDAVALAVHPDSVGQGVLVAFDDQILPARDVTKTNTVRTDAFRSPYGPLGEMLDGRPHFVRRVARRHTRSSAFSLADFDELPRVEQMRTYPDMPLEALDALVDGAAGLVHVGAGNGNVSRPVLERLDRYVAQGMTVVRCSRVGAGVVTRNGAGNDDRHGFIAADDHNPGKARILLSLALTKTHDPAEIQQLFWEH